MKKSLLLVLIGSLLMACHSDIDVNNVDTSAELELGVAIKVGSIRAELGDFVEYVDHLFIDTLSDGTCIITWRDTFPDNREYHKFNMKDHISNKTLNLNVYEKAEAAQIIGPDGKITGYDRKDTLTFDLPLQLKDINKTLGEERLDSATIDVARFTSIIRRTDLPLEWDWIDEVQLVLGDQVYREAGNIMTIYTKGESGGYGQKIDTEVDKFSVSLMKDKTLNVHRNTYIQYEQNVVDSVVFKVNFIFTVPSSAGQVTIPTTARFNYTLEVEFIDYEAMWGYFDPDPDMISEDVEIELSKEWKSLKFLEYARMPFTEPTVDAAVTTKIAGAMMMTGKYLYAVNKDGDSTYATFNGMRQRPTERMLPYMDPDPTVPGSAIGDSVTTHVIFNNTEEKGRIDRLFRRMPQKMGYNFRVEFDKYETPEIRMTPDDRVTVNAICNLPLKFGDSLFIDYLDTITDVNLSKVDIDSLIGEVEWLDTLRTSDIFLYLTAKSEIPLMLKGVFTYMDENNNILMDPDDPSKPFNPFLDDTIRIAPPHYTRSKTGGWSMDIDKNGDPTVTTLLTAAMTKPKLDLLPKIKNIRYHIIVDNDALEYAYKQGIHEFKLTSDLRLKMDIGLTAKLDAVMDLDKIKK